MQILMVDTRAAGATRRLTPEVLPHQYIRADVPTGASLAHLLLSELELA